MVTPFRFTWALLLRNGVDSLKVGFDAAKRIYWSVNGVEALVGVRLPRFREIPSYYAGSVSSLGACVANGTRNYDTRKSTGCRDGKKCALGDDSFLSAKIVAICFVITPTGGRLLLVLWRVEKNKLAFKARL